MAYMSQEKKRELAPAIKQILKKYGIKGSLSVRNHSTLVLTLREGGIDFLQNFEEVTDRDAGHHSGHMSINPYHYQNHFSGEALAFLSEVVPVMNTGNWDKSDIQSDYFNVGWYIEVSIGKWNKAYTVTR